jgi:hypothetical protein
MTSPPNGILLEVQLPEAIERRQRYTINTTKPSGQRLYTNTISNASLIGSSKKQYEVGQILEFTAAKTSTLRPMLVSNSLEVQHNTNTLDLSSLGISDADIIAINNSADTQFTALNAALSAVRQARINTETSILENQKNQNETQKAIDALVNLVRYDSSLQGVLGSLRTKLVELQAQASSLIVLANTQASSASSLENQIIAIAQMVR